MTTQKTSRQYGLWTSPITAISLARGISFSDLAWDQDNTLIWREGRSDRGVLVVQPPDGQASRDLNSDYNVRAGVGYGGGDFTAGAGYVYFVEAKSGRLYRQLTHSGMARALTPAFGSAASPALSPDGAWLLFVHSLERQDSIAIVDAQGLSWPQKLVSGADFYMQPCWHPNGKRLAWIEWNHPNMPWDGTRLKMGLLSQPEQGLPVLKETQTVAGGETVSIFQPAFSPDGRYLAYVSDESGWWHLYVYDLEKGQATVLTGGEAEHAEPAWAQGQRTFGFSANGKAIYFIRSQDGFRGLWRVELESKMQERVRIGSEYTWLSQVAVAPSGEQVAVIASGGRTPPRVIVYSPENGTRILARSLAEDVPPKTYALPQAINWQDEQGELAYGLYYAPQSEKFTGVGKPPLLVLVHGGPTGQRGAHFDSQAQFFASRGWGVLQVNYRGSAGYGRAYREALKGQWGIYDVADAVAGARHLISENLVDADKVVIMGGSAGGFTVLKALEDYPGFFKAGANLYGVANQFTLAADTHKFEERYLDSLLGPLPEAAELYRERSPLFYADRIKDPVIVFQGEEDKVVPPAQSDEIVAALQRNGVPHEYHRYPGEGHGFRKSETIEQFYNSLVAFLRQYVIFG
ncbi:MAG: S9 family peptidase [Anaerolineales bacterium]|nr:S9 family peptidase [Anaerolineales bacterium]